MSQIPGTGLLGFGVNVLQTNPETAATQSILSPPTGSVSKYEWNGVEYTVPENVSVTPGFGDQTTSGTVLIANSRGEFQSEYNARFGLTAAYNAFSSVFNLAFSSETKATSQYWYGAVLAEYEAYSLLVQETGEQQISAAFLNDPDVVNMIQQVDFDISNPEPFYAVFAKWGTHYIYQISMGASLAYYSAVQSTYSSDQTTIIANLELEYDGVFVDAGAKASADWTELGQSWASSRSISISAVGGDTSLLSAIDPAFGENFNTQFSSWRTSIPGNIAVARYYLRDLSTLFSGKTQALVEQAINAWLGGIIIANAAMTIGQTTQSSAVNIEVAGSSMVPSEPITPSMGGSVQLVALNPVDFSVLLNMGASCQLDASGDWGAEYAAFWEPFATALDSISTPNYVLVFVAGGIFNTSGFPTPALATLLQACGMGLSTWIESASWYCGDDFNICYAGVGQQGVGTDQAIEGFSIDAPEGQPGQIVVGPSFATATGILIPSTKGGNYTLVPSGAG